MRDYDSPTQELRGMNSATGGEAFKKQTDPERPAGLRTEAQELSAQIERVERSVGELAAVLESGGLLLSFPEVEGKCSPTAPDASLCPAADHLRTSRRQLERLSRQIVSLTRQVNL